MALKEEIKNYKYYKIQQARIRNAISLLLYELTGVKGIRYDSVQYTADPRLNEERRLELLDKMEKKQKELGRVSIQIEFIEQYLKELNEEDRALIKYVLVDGHTYKQAERKFFITYSAVAKRIYKILGGKYDTD